MNKEEEFYLFSFAVFFHFNMNMFFLFYFAGFFLTCIQCTIQVPVTMVTGLAIQEKLKSNSNVGIKMSKSGKIPTLLDPMSGKS